VNKHLDKAQTSDLQFRQSADLAYHIDYSSVRGLPFDQQPVHPRGGSHNHRPSDFAIALNFVPMSLGQVPSAPGFAIDELSSQYCQRPRAMAQNSQTRAERWNNPLRLNMCRCYDMFVRPEGGSLILIAKPMEPIARPTIAVMVQALKTSCKRNSLTVRLVSGYLTQSLRLPQLVRAAQLATRLPPLWVSDWASAPRTRVPGAVCPLFPH